MNHQDLKRPSLSVFALALIFLLSIVCAVTGGEGWQTATGCIVLGTGAWASWNIGRWAWWRYGPRVTLDYQH